jgi:peptidyl-prolyl cis-trans isomerase D
MLKFFKRLERTRNFVLLTFAVVMVASLVLFYRPMQDAVGADLGRSEETAARAAGYDITVGEVYRQKAALSRTAQGPSYPARTILNDLIGNRIARAEAKRLGLTATDAEVAAAVREQFKPRDGKPFDRQAYEQTVMNQAGSISAYEEAVRDSLSAQKVKAFVTSGVMVSEQELLADFERKNSTFDLSYVSISANDLAKNISPSEQELRDYFEKNKAAYYVATPQKKIRYVFVNTSKIGEKMQISEQELREEYDKLPEERKIAGVLGQEIVLRVPAPNMEEQVMSKAGELIRELKKTSDLVTETAFADVARGHSENPATAQNGGKLRGPVRQNPANPDDPYQRLLDMKPGEVTEPISYQGRYFILRRGEAVPKSFEDAKKEIEISLRNRKAYGVAAELAQKVADALKQNKDVEATARQFAAEANMSPSEMVRETAYVKPNDNVEHIGTSPQFEEGIAGLENPNDVGDKIPVPNGFAVPLLVDKKDPRDAEFGEVRAQVLETVKLEKARAQVEELAKQIADGTANASALAAAAQARGLKAERQISFVLGSPLGQGPSASTNKEFEDTLYAMKEGEVTKALKIGENWVVVGLQSRKGANMDDFAKNRDSLLDQMIQKKRNEVFADYMVATRRRLEADGQIRIYDDAVAKIDAATLLPSDLQ